MFPIFLSVFDKFFFIVKSLYLFGPVLLFSIFYKGCFPDFAKFTSSSPRDYDLFLSLHMIKKGNKPSAEQHFLILF